MANKPIPVLILKPDFLKTVKRFISDYIMRYKQVYNTPDEDIALSMIKAYWLGMPEMTTTHLILSLPSTLKEPSITVVLKSPRGYKDVKGTLCPTFNYSKDSLVEEVLAQEIPYVLTVLEVEKYVEYLSEDVKTPFKHSVNPN